MADGFVMAWFKKDTIHKLERRYGSRLVVWPVYRKEATTPQNSVSGKVQPEVRGGESGILAAITKLFAPTDNKGAT